MQKTQADSRLQEPGCLSHWRHSWSSRLRHSWPSWHWRHFASKIFKAWSQTFRSAKCHSALPGGMFLRRNRTPSSVASTQDLPSEDDMNTPEVPGPVPIDSTWPHQKDPKGLHRWWSLESGGTWRRWRVWRSRGSRSRWRWSRIRRRGLLQCLQMCIALSNHRVCRWFWSIMFIADCSAVFYTWNSLGICNFLGTFKSGTSRCCPASAGICCFQFAGVRGGRD